MSNKESTDYGIKYSVKKVNEELYVLTPVDIVEGYSVAETFYSTEIHKTLYGIESLSEEFLIDSIASVESLKRIYDYDDLEFIKDFYLEEEKDYLIFIEIKDKKMIKRKINLSQLVQVQEKETYERQKDLPTVTLNCDALDNLLNSLSIQEVREKLEEYRKKIKQFRDREKKEGLTSITVNNGHVSEISLNKKVATPNQTIQVATSEKDPAFLLNGRPRDISSFTVRGLEQYLKERVFGHDEEIRKIATTMIMNYRAKPEFGTESILIAGPTGTGKTETGRAASEYFSVPFVAVNSANLVPQGIKGSSLEDYLYALITASNYDLERAQRGFIFLDEFDKVGHDGLDLRESIKNIFLKFIEGDTFMIDKPTDDYNFNTKMLNKMFSGAFTDLFETQKKEIGFGAQQQAIMEFKPENIEKAQYFGKELITRIEHIFAYMPLSTEVKRRVILESKLSRLKMKKKRYEEEFKVELIALDSYIDALLERLSEKDKSMRDLNNLILSSLSEVEYALLDTEGKAKKLILSRETVENPKNFDLN